MKNEERLFTFRVLKKMCKHKIERHDSKTFGNYLCPLVAKRKTTDGMCKAVACPFWNDNFTQGKQEWKELD